MWFACIILATTARTSRFGSPCFRAMVHMLSPSCTTATSGGEGLVLPVLAVTGHTPTASVVTPRLIHFTQRGRCIVLPPLANRSLCIALLAHICLLVNSPSGNFKRLFAECLQTW